MKKSQKILLSTLLPISLVGTLSTAVLATSCSNSSSAKFNEETFKKNANKKYMDLAGTKLEDQNSKMDTVNLAKSILGTKDGMKLYSETYSDVFLVDWFSKTKDPILSTFYNDELKTIKDEYDEQKKSYKDMNLFQREVLDPTGGTQNTYIFQKLLPKLKQELSGSLFSKDYLGIKDSSGEIIKLDPQNSDAVNAIDKKENVNATTAGTRNNFVFSPKAVTSYSAFDDYYADFVNFIFEEWTTETLPIITPTVLFKQSTGVSPKDSGLFNVGFFGTSGLESADSNYKFQWFDPANNDYKNPNSSMKYKTFVSKINSFVNADTGAIQIDKYLTDDKSVMLITNGKTCYTDYVAPFAAAAMYNFAEAVLGNDNGTAIGTGTLDASDIMTNFIQKNNGGSNGYFNLPYDTANAFNGAYSGVKSIRETFKVNSGPFIATRDEFGVHIIGVDRYAKIKEAASKKTNARDKMKAAIVELQNTILWRVAQKAMFSSDTELDNIDLDLKSKLKTYFDENASKLIFKYLLKNNPTSTVPPTKEEANPSPAPTKFLFSKETIEDDKELMNIIDKNSSEYKLMDAVLEMQHIQSAMDFTNEVDEKIYTHQSTYVMNDKYSEWKTYGLAGVLPYTKNANSSLEQLTNIALKPLLPTSKAGISFATLYDSAKAKLLEAINGLTSLEPASTTNYFKEKVGEQLGVSQYQFTNNWNINQILVKETSDTTVVEIYNSLWEDYSVDKDLVDFTSTSNTTPPPSKPKETTPTENNFNKTVANALKEQIKSNYSIKKTDDSPLFTATLDLDFTSYDKLKESANKWIKNEIDKNRIGNGYEISYSAESEFKTFLKTLTWLLRTTDEETTNSTYTFGNLIKILKEMIDNEDTGVAYLGWSSESTLFAEDNFGTNVQNDFKYKKFQPYIVNINSYSYSGATDPFTQAKTDVYYGSNKETYFNAAKPTKTATDLYNGFVGFQSSDSSMFSSVLPHDLYSGKILTQDPTGADNFKGVFYRFNDGTQTGSATRAEDFTKYKTNMKNYYADDSFKLTTLAKQFQQYGLGILDNKITFEQKEILIKHALKMVVEGATTTNNALTWEQRKTLMDSIVDKVPDKAFQQLDGYSLTRTKNGQSIKLFDGEEGNLRQYVVSQFNMNDVINFENKVKTMTESSNSDELSFANIDLSTFYAAIVILAQNTEIQSRANAHWSTISKEKKVTVFNYNVAKKLGETVVKNWDDFK